LRDDAGAALRARQLDAAAAWAQHGERRPLVIAGDFNAGVQDPEVREFVRRHDADFGADASALASSTLRHRAGASVDHVALVGGGPRWHVCARDTVLTEIDPVTGVWPSDHFGVLATLASQARPTTF
jgi:endonuclease/exonuclease/phosphatase family metal-dependent hydrolase